MKDSQLQLGATEIKKLIKQYDEESKSKKGVRVIDYNDFPHTFEEYRDAFRLLCFIFFTNVLISSLLLFFSALLLTTLDSPVFFSTDMYGNVQQMVPFKIE